MSQITEKTVANVFATRPRECHKGLFGTVALFGGSNKYSGAVKLANLAAAAMRGGCGVVRLAVEETLAPAVMPYLLESTLFPYQMDGEAPKESQIAEALHGVRGVGCGMGWEPTRTTAATLQLLVRHADCPILADAGAIRILAEDTALFDKVRYPLILTPHPGEFAALTGKSIQEVTTYPVPLAEAFAATYDCTVILKGATTIVTDGEATYEVDRGGAGMATAGSGDVLAGVLTGMLGYLEPTPLHLAAGVFLTGVAGELAEAARGDITMVASDTATFLPQALLQIREAGA